MDLSVPNVATETSLTEAQLSQDLRSWYSSNADHVVSKENGMSESHNEKLRAALAWLGARYLCATPQKRRVRK